MTRIQVKRLFKKQSYKDKKLTHMILQGTSGTATRAVYTGYNEIPRILAAFRVPYSKDPKSGEKFDAIEIEMDLYAAVDFCQQLLNAIDAASPRHPRSARHTQYGEGGDV